MKTKQKNGFVTRIRASIAQWVGGPFTLTDTEALSVVYGEGGGLTVKKVMQLDTVWACVRIISETISTLPLSLFEQTANGKQVASSHQVHFIIHDQPNVDSAPSVYWEAVVASMLLRGASYSEKLYVGDRIVGVRFLNPDRLQISRDLQGNKTYHYIDPHGNTRRQIAADRIWMIPGFTLNGEDGVSVIKYGTKVFGAALAAENAAANTFKNGLLQQIYYKVATFLKPEMRAEFQKNLKGTFERGEVPLLENGVDVGTLGINPSDAQLLESRSFSVESICRWFRVDPSLVGHGSQDSNWGTGLEQKMIWFLTFTLGPWLKRIEQAIRKDLLTPVERLKYYAKFNVEGLLRADSAGRAAFYSVMVNCGILTRDEVRELEDRAPMGGNAAVLTVQSAMTTLDGLGADQQTTQLRAQMLALLGLDKPTDKED